MGRRWPIPGGAPDEFGHSTSQIGEQRKVLAGVVQHVHIGERRNAGRRFAISVSTCWGKKAAQGTCLPGGIPEPPSLPSTHRRNH